MDRLLLSLSTTVTGMLVVFLGLVILIACIYALTSVVAHPRKEAPAPKAEAAPIVPVRDMQIDEPDEENDLQVVAAITAALTMILSTEGKGSGFVVRRVRRAAASSPRARAAREEQIYSRM